MEAELAMLVESGVAALGGLMVTDAYTRLRPRLSNLMRRRSEGQQVQAIEEVDRLRRELMDAQRQGGESAERAIRDSLRTQLRQVIEADPDAASELAALIRELQSELCYAKQSSVTFAGNTFHGPVQGSGVQNISM
ncbi:hypothetical protein ACFQVC_13005 [Streptomyces monticola]|uniref:ATP-binding protein n=1 Tax=Streptomyces monticola TaxID=2666263 RepID=A0ABW2JHT2_9ACTN